MLFVPAIASSPVAPVRAGSKLGRSQQETELKTGACQRHFSLQVNNGPPPFLSDVWGPHSPISGVSRWFPLELPEIELMEACHLGSLQNYVHTSLLVYYTITYEYLIGLVSETKLIETLA